MTTHTVIFDANGGAGATIILPAVGTEITTILTVVGV